MTTDTFIAGRGFLYTIDPRAKALLLVLSIIWFFLPVTLVGLGFMVACFVVVALWSFGRKATTRVFFSILPMLVFMVLFMPFSRRDGTPWVMIKSFMLLSKEGATQTLLLSLRFVGITYACALVFSSSKMYEVMLALQWYKMPYKAVLVITLAFTSIPFISDSFLEIKDSHKLRESADTPSRFRLKDMVPTLTSALVVSLRSIPFLAMSLEERGYGRKEKRTNYHDLSRFRHPLRDFLAVILFFVLFTVLFRS